MILLKQLDDIIDIHRFIYTGGTLFALEHGAYGACAITYQGEVVVIGGRNSTYNFVSATHWHGKVDR